MKKTILFFLLCLVLSLLMGCTALENGTADNTSSSKPRGYSVGLWKNSTYEEEIRDSDGFVRATCTDKVLNRDTNQIDTTFSVTEVYFGDVPLQTMTFGLYPRLERWEAPWSESEYLSVDEVAYEPGKDYLLLLTETASDSPSCGYSMVAVTCIPYDDIFSGKLIANDLPEKTVGFSITPDTTAEELIAYTLSTLKILPYNVPMEPFNLTGVHEMALRADMAIGL